MKKLYIVPDGGIGNRLRAIASGIYLAHATQSEPTIVWHKDLLCNAGLEDIIDVNRLPARITTPTETVYRCVFEVARKRNLLIPALVAPLRFSRRYYDETNLISLCDDCEKLQNEINQTNGDVLLFSGQEFFDFPRDFFRSIFHVTPAVAQRASEILQGRYPKFAIQIRRTDHRMAIENSPEALFIDRIKEYDDSSSFFLATDDNMVKERFRTLFGERAIMNATEARRDTPEGIVDAMAEIRIMAQTERIFASLGSSFPEIASWMGNVELIRVGKV